jgi:hypothetical protein
MAITLLLKVASYTHHGYAEKGMVTPVPGVTGETQRSTVEGTALTATLPATAVTPGPTP